MPCGRGGFPWRGWRRWAGRGPGPGFSSFIPRILRHSSPLPLFGARSLFTTPTAPGVGPRRSRRLDRRKRGCGWGADGIPGGELQWLRMRGERRAAEGVSTGVAGWRPTGRHHLPTRSSVPRGHSRPRPGRGAGTGRRRCAATTSSGGRGVTQEPASMVAGAVLDDQAAVGRLRPWADSTRRHFPGASIGLSPSRPGTQSVPVSGAGCGSDIVHEEDRARSDETWGGVSRAGRGHGSRCLDTIPRVHSEPATHITRKGQPQRSGHIDSHRSPVEQNVLALLQGPERPLSPSISVP